jgi:hypothetical protein
MCVRPWLGQDFGDFPYIHPPLHLWAEVFQVAHPGEILKVMKFNLSTLQTDKSAS